MMLVDAINDNDRQQKTETKVMKESKNLSGSTLFKIQCHGKLKQILM